MNRYESAYRDYTQRPETGGHHRQQNRQPARAARQDSGNSNSSSESNVQHSSAERGFSTEQASVAQPYQISTRELSDRSSGGQRNNGERANSEFTVTNPAIQARNYQRSPSLGSDSYSERNSRDDRYYEERSGSVVGVAPEIYIPQPEFMHQTPTSELSHDSYRTYRSAPFSEVATMRSKTSKRGGIVIESTRAPHPLCPNTRGCCCLMLLFNLGLLLLCLGFVIVFQLHDPPFVWYLGVFMLVFGFVTIFVGLIFCAWMCREGSPDAPVPASELYWTHHWRKTIQLPEVHGRVHETTVKEPIDDIRYLDETGSYSGQKYHHQHHSSSRY